MAADLAGAGSAGRGPDRLAPAARSATRSGPTGAPRLASRPPHRAAVLGTHEPRHPRLQGDRTRQGAQESLPAHLEPHLLPRHSSAFGLHARPLRVQGGDSGLAGGRRHVPDGGHHLRRPPPPPRRDAGRRADRRGARGRRPGDPVPRGDVDPRQPGRAAQTIAVGARGRTGTGRPVGRRPLRNAARRDARLPQRRLVGRDAAHSPRPRSAQAPPHRR